MIVLYVFIGLSLFIAILWSFLLHHQRRHPGWNKLIGYRYAHRGLHNLEKGIPENSLSAFQTALEQGFGAELDVHLMADGKLAVVHDSSLKRVCGVDVLVEDLTAEQLIDYPLLGGDGAYIPLLEDVLALFTNGTPLLIELKVERDNAVALTDAVMAVLADWKGVYCIQSFIPEVVSHLRKHYPKVIRGLLGMYFMRDRERNSRWCAFYVVTNWLMCTVQTRPDFISYMWKDPAAHYLRRMCQRQGIKTFCWTIQDEQTMLRLETEGCIPIFEGFVPN